MTRLVLFPDEKTQLTLEIAMPPAELERQINHGIWQPPAAQESLLIDAAALLAVRLGTATVLAFPRRLQSSGALGTPAGLTLSPRQFEILQHLADGLSVKQIGRLLGISERTVFLHTAGLRQKLHALTTAEALSLAAGLGLVRPRRSGKTSFENG